VTASLKAEVPYLHKRYREGKSSVSFLTTDIPHPDLEGLTLING